MAGGGLLQCTHMISDCQWQCANAQFTNSFKILPLKCYDGILGMDWLSKHSPMQVDWESKWLAFEVNGQSIFLQVENTIAPFLSIVEVHLIQPDSEQKFSPQFSCC